MRDGPRSERIRINTGRGSDRPIAAVSCPCGEHFYCWRERAFRARTADGLGPITPDAEIPLSCRRAFGRGAVERSA